MAVLHGNQTHIKKRGNFTQKAWWLYKEYAEGNLNKT